MGNAPTSATKQVTHIENTEHLDDGRSMRILACPLPSAAPKAAFAEREKYFGFFPIRFPRGAECLMTARTNKGRANAVIQVIAARQGE